MLPKNQELIELVTQNDETIDPQFYITDENMTVFEKCLLTPNNCNKIKECIKNQAKLFEVRFRTKMFSPKVKSSMVLS